MLFHLLMELREQFNPLNVFRYTSFRMFTGFFSALVVTLVLFPWFIRQLQHR